ncbi:MAG: DUF4878 domain-containing protein [Treponema sp.]|nr:DUF4878 domain-containing protein [Treponema sp.]
MKKLSFALALIIVLLIAGCSAGGSPKGAVQDFIKAVEKNDMEALAKVSTQETAQLMAMFGEKAQGTAKEFGKIKSMTEKIDGDKAVVNVVFDNGENSDFHLVKEDGKWKVSINMNK